MRRSLAGGPGAVDPSCWDLACPCLHPAREPLKAGADRPDLKRPVDQVQSRTSDDPTIGLAA